MAHRCEPDPRLPAPTRPSLAKYAQAAAGIDLPKSGQVSDWTRPALSGDQLNYAALDVAVLADSGIMGKAAGRTRQGLRLGALPRRRWRLRSWSLPGWPTWCGRARLRATVSRAFSGYKTAPITIGASFRARKKGRSTRHARGPSRPGSVLYPSLLWIGAVAPGYRIGLLFEKPAAFHYRPFSTPR